MEILTRILVGLLIMGLGVLMVFKTQWFLSLVGMVNWAERTFGGGGSRFFYKLLGTALSILGLIVATNLFERLFGGFILSLFGM